MTTAEAGDEEVPKVLVREPSFGPTLSRLRQTFSRSEGSSRRAFRTSRRESDQQTKSTTKHVRLAEPVTEFGRDVSSSSGIYLGSYGRSPRNSRSQSRVSLGISPSASANPSPRASLSTIHINHLLENLNIDLETYGVEEFRDGFFDAAFFKPPEEDFEDLMDAAELTLPVALRKSHPLSVSAFLPRQLHEIKGVLRRVTTTRSGIKLFKSFAGFFVAYILCLVPVINEWLGPISYVMPISAILNHAGRPIGAQIDGALLTIFGTASGLGWGAFALWLSDSTAVSRNGYGGILAAFLFLFVGIMAAMRSYFIRSYQFVLTAGMAFIYTCLAHATETPDWRKLFNWGVPWLFGQVICLVVCFIVFPDGGARPLAVSLHAAFDVMHRALRLPNPDRVACSRELPWTFVNLSQAYRDLAMDISVTRFHPSDILELRNLMQAVIRAFLSFKTETDVFNPADGKEKPASHDLIIDIEGNRVPPLPADVDDDAVRLVNDHLGPPTHSLLESMREALMRCDAVLLEMSGYRKYLGPSPEVSSDIPGALTSIRKAMIKFDDEDDALANHPELPDTFSDRQELVRLFLFANPIRQAATTVEALLVYINRMQQERRGWRLFLPSYPFSKAVQRTNAQVRHDRGGATAGFFFRSQKQLSRQLQHMHKTTYKPMSRLNQGIHVANDDDVDEDHDVLLDHDMEGKTTMRYNLWSVLHRLQGFEMRFALKVIIVVSLLAVPAWLSQSRGWYNEHSCWWAVIFVWLMMHPRVGGNFQDLVTRSLAAIVGAAWGGFAYAARDGNPYVIAVFAAIYMLPMMYRYTQSSHPRSGVVGCLSFTIVSLDANLSKGGNSISETAWTRGASFVVGITAAIIVNWILWPFVARHELRKSISAMMLHMAIVYRRVVAKYIYYESGEEPNIEDVTESELLEGRLREGFVRIRQLMALTRHEIRLRGPFDPRPYSALIENCESFFSHLVEVRQSSLFFHPNYLGGNEYASSELLPFRRDAVASILMNLYILAGALRGNRKVPRYLPSAAAARKKLLDRMAELEVELAGTKDRRTKIVNDGVSGHEKGVGRKFAEVYQFAYSQALIECVEQLEQLTRYTKVICGEVGFDPVDET